VVVMIARVRAIIVARHRRSPEFQQGVSVALARHRPTNRSASPSPCPSLLSRCCVPCACTDLHSIAIPPLSQFVARSLGPIGIRLLEHRRMAATAAKPAAFNGSAIKLAPHRRNKRHPYNTSTNPLSVLKDWLVKNEIRKLPPFSRLIASDQSHRDAIWRSDCISDRPSRHSAALHCQVLFPLVFQPCYPIVQ